LTIFHESIGEKNILFPFEADVKIPYARSWLLSVQITFYKRKSFFRASLIG
uniref:Uncharacterized protein n=1 Tax=Fundulus heteroclitus TaxID=8078 RepID=A0A3Q2NXZ4_FUNHE